jgi:hypothetical protein
MRMIQIRVLILLVFSILFLGARSFCAPAQEGNKVFTGEIMDSQCAAMGSHDQMMKPEGAKDAKECTLKCVQGGGKFVLYDSANKTAYQLDDQEKPKQFAGQKVKVTGTADAASKTIHVESIEGS